MKKFLYLLLLIPLLGNATKKPSILFDPATNPIVEGASKSFGIRLDELPTSSVTVSFSAQYGYVTLTSSLTFTTGNYFTPQSFTITGVDDGVINGNKLEKVTITTSGGGYSAIKSFFINVTDSGLDSQFLSGYNWKEREFNGITITNAGDIATRRATMISYVFNGAGLPTDDTPAAITVGHTGTLGQTDTSLLTGFTSVNRLQWIFTDPTAATWTHYVYHIFASVPNGKLVMVQGGHSSELYHKEIINQLLAAGFDIAYVSMPSTFQNVETNASVGGTGVSAHNAMNTLEPSMNAMEIFFFDKIKSLNYFDTNYSYTDYYITGCSGGGWTTMMLMAMDTRFTKGVSVRGTAPVQFRNFTNAGTTADWDLEQGSIADINGITSAVGFSTTGIRNFYLSITYFDLYLMACSGGRSIHLSHHAADSCCHNKFTYNLWSDYIKSLASSYGGTFNLTLNTNASYTTHGWNVNDRAIIASEF